ncbi:MAG: hypothetical protein QM778_25145 [Myxococcales bacterium]
MSVMYAMMPWVMRRALFLCLVSILLSVWSSASSAQEQPAAAPEQQPEGPQVGPDMVRLRTGTMWRGTIVERTPSRVVMVTYSGETKRFESWNIDFAGPAPTASEQCVAAPSVPGPSVEPTPSLPAPAPVAPAPMAPTVSPSSVQLRLTPLDGYSIYLDTGGGLSRPCVGPCVAKLAPGLYRTGVGKGGRPTAAPGTLEIRQDDELRGSFLSRRKQRIIGGIILGLGAPLGAGLVAAGIHVKDLKVSCEVGGDCNVTNNKLEPFLITTGVLVALASAITGGYFVAQKDQAFVQAQKARVVFDQKDAPGPAPFEDTDPGAHLSDSQLLEANREGLARCNNGYLSNVHVLVQITAEGSVSQAAVQSTDAWTIRSCMESVIQSLRFPAGKPRSVEHTY